MNINLNENNYYDLYEFIIDMNNSTLNDFIAGVYDFNNGISQYTNALKNKTKILHIPVPIFEEKTNKTVKDIIEYIDYIKFRDDKFFKCPAEGCDDRSFFAGYCDFHEDIEPKEHYTTVAKFLLDIALVSNKITYKEKREIEDEILQYRGIALGTLIKYGSLDYIKEIFEEEYKLFPEEFIDKVNSMIDSPYKRYIDRKKEKDKLKEKIIHYYCTMKTFPEFVKSIGYIRNKHEI